MGRRRLQGKGTKRTWAQHAATAGAAIMEGVKRARRAAKVVRRVKKVYKKFTKRRTAKVGGGGRSAVTGAQWLKKKRTSGRKITRLAVAQRALVANIDTIKYGIRGYYDGFEKSDKNLKGYYAAVRQPFNAVIGTAGSTMKVVALPVYLFHLTGGLQAANPQSGDSDYWQGPEDNPVWQLFYHQEGLPQISSATYRVLPTPGNYYWVNTASQGSLGSDGSKGLLYHQEGNFKGYTSSSSIITGGATGVDAARCLGNRAVQAWIRFRCNLWACTNCVSQWHIDIVSPTEDGYVPEANAITLGTGSTDGYLVPNAVNNTDFQQWCQKFMTTCVANPIAAIPGRVPKVWKHHKSEKWTGDPKTSIEIDTNPYVKTIDWFMRENKSHAFDLSNNPNQVIPPGSSGFSNRDYLPLPVPAKGSNRKYAMVWNQNFGAQAPSDLAVASMKLGTAGGVNTTLNYSSTTDTSVPSFDVNIEMCWKTIN